MKVFRKIIVGVLGVIIMSDASALAAQPYFHAGIGPSFIQDNTITTTGSRESFDAGVRLDVAVGVDFDEHWAAEFETGLIANRLNAINGVSVSPREIDFYQVPLLANVIYRIPTGTRWFPYVGIGCGGVSTSVDATLPDFNASDFTFAYQVKAGVEFDLAPNMLLDFGYKFLGSQDHKFDDGGATRTKEFYTHALMVSYTWQF